MHTKGDAAKNPQHPLIILLFQGIVGHEPVPTKKRVLYQLAAGASPRPTGVFAKTKSYIS